MRRRISVTPVALSISPERIPLTSVLITVTPPPSFCMNRGGNMKTGKNPSLDMTSHIATITITNVTLLKIVVIAKFLLQYFFHFFFQLSHDLFFQFNNDAVRGVSRPGCLHFILLFDCSRPGAHQEYPV